MSDVVTGSVRASGGRLVDSAGNEVVLSGVNWFGAETSVFAPHGLWMRNWRDMLEQIRETGFNLIRLPFSNELLEPSSQPNSIDFTKNPDLKGLTGLQIMDRIIAGAGARGLKIILDRHRPTAAGQSALWYTEQVPQTRWISDWRMLAHRYHDQPAVLGADLHNEPHGPCTWGDGNPATDWRLAAEEAGNAILAVNPQWLIFVEGIETYDGASYWWGGNLEGARPHAVRLSDPSQLVYSAHDYGPEVAWQAWFGAANYPENLAAIWQRYWAFLARSGEAPVFIGEFGGRSVGNDPEGKWQRTLVAFLKANRLGYAYWAWNPDSGDTGGLLEDDWMTINPSKLSLLKQYQGPVLS